MSSEDNLVEMIHPEDDERDSSRLSNFNTETPLVPSTTATSIQNHRMSYSAPDEPYFLESVEQSGSPLHTRRSSSIPPPPMIIPQNSLEGQGDDDDGDEEARDRFPSATINPPPPPLSFRPNSIPDDISEPVKRQSIGDIDIEKLQKSMQLRSAYLNYTDIDDASDDYEPESDDHNNDWSNDVANDVDDNSDLSIDDDKDNLAADPVVDFMDNRRPDTAESGKPAPTKNVSSVASCDSSVTSGSSEDSPVRRRRHVKPERENTILTFEIFAKGDNKYCHRSMRSLFMNMLKGCQSHDVPVVPVLPLGDMADATASAGGWTSAARQGADAPASPSTPTASAVTSSGIGFMQLRDLRRLEYLFTPQEEPAILVRRHAVVISLDPLRVVVMADRLILLVPDGADMLIQVLSNQMQAHTGELSLNIPFEMQAFEAIFGTVIEIQKLQLSDLESRIKRVSRILRKYSIVPVEVQEKVQMFKQRVSEMIERARGHKRIMEELLEEDDHLALMALSLLKNKPHLYNTPLEPEIMSKHEDGESLLESYLMDYNSLQSKLTLLNSQLNGAEALVSLRLDTSRNELLITNTVVSVVSCTFAVGGYVGALLGMNLRNGFENDSTDTFWSVCIVTSVLVILTTIGTIIYLKFTEILPSRFNHLSQHEISKL